MMTAPRQLAALLISVLGASAVAAPASPLKRPDQIAPGTDQITFQDLRRVDSQFSDVSALAASARNLDADTRVPNDFRGVYQIPKNENSPYAGWFVRQQGGVLIAFPQSEYAFDEKRGVYPVVPTSAQYFLGGIPRTGLGLPAAPANDTTASGYVNTATSTAAPSTRIEQWQPLAVQPAAGLALKAPGVQARPEPSLDPLSIAQRSSERLILDPRYRAARLTQLIDRAAAAQP